MKIIYLETEIHPPHGSQVEFGLVEYQTMRSMGTMYSPTHDMQLMGPPAYTTYPAGVFSSYTRSESGYYDYRKSGPFGYLGGNYLSYPNRGITGDGAYGNDLPWGEAPDGVRGFPSGGPHGPPGPQG